MSSQTFSFAVLILSLYLVVGSIKGQEATAGTQSKCDVVRCGYGARCQVVAGKAECKCPSICTKIYEPVCGSDGKNYGNPCTLQVAACESKKSIEVVSKGRCLDSASSTKRESSSGLPELSSTTTPVDQTDPCSMQKCSPGARCEVIDGKAECSCSSVCPQIFSPVCGSDGKSYGNSCTMQIAACQTKKSITKVSEGNCPSSSTTTKATIKSVPSNTTDPTVKIDECIVELATKD